MNTNLEIIIRGLAKRAENVLDTASIAKISTFIQSKQNANGGFQGRSEKSDVYYTLFGVECAEILQISLNFNALSNYLVDQINNFQSDLVHLSCLARCIHLIENEEDTCFSKKLIINEILKFKHAKGGFRLSQDFTNSSIYAGFISKLALDNFEIEIENIPEFIKSIQSKRCLDGSFSETENSKSGITNLTAAACSIFYIYDQPINSETISWFLSLYRDGGFLAVSYAPMPDLLSTATALCALHLAGFKLSNLKAEILEFIQSLWCDDGGFLSHDDDQETDVEYTYYALLCIGILDLY